MNNKPTVTRKVQRRKLDASDIIGVAKLVSKGLTEAEACRRLDIVPQQWRAMKLLGQNDERFAALLEGFKAERIDAIIDQIEAIGQGQGVKQKDWRALFKLLEITDKRFNDRLSADLKNPPVNQVNIFATLDIKGIGARVYAEDSSKTDSISLARTGKMNHDQDT